MARLTITAIGNQKGGVGKTSTTLGLAAALNALGRRVLVLDIDAQANATSTLDAAGGFDMYDVLGAEDGAPLSGVFGAGIVLGEGYSDVVLVATGSEVALCVTASERLAAAGVSARVVSMPSWDRFEEQNTGFQRGIFPPNVPVLAVEAAATMGWHKYADDVIGIERFGASAPGALVLDRLGINVDHVVERAQALLAD